MALSEDEIEKLRAEHGEVWEVVVAEQQIFFRCPTEPEADRFMARASEKRDFSIAAKRLVRDVVVYPAGADLDAYMKKRPMAYTTIVGQITRAAGIEQEQEAKKR